MGGRREGDQQSHECRNTGVRQHRQRSTHTHLAMRVRGLHSTHMPHHTHGSLHTQAARVPQRHAAQRHVNTPCAGSAHHAHAPPPAWRPRVSPTPASHGPGRLARPRTASHVAGGGGCLPRTDCISQWRSPARPRVGQRALAHASHTGTGMHTHALHLAHVCCTPGTRRDATRAVWEFTHMQRHCAHMLHTRCTGRRTRSVQAQLPRVHIACTRIAHMVHAWHMHMHPITYVCTQPP